MLRLFSILFSVFGLFGASNCQASVRGTYCSGTTTDGAWAFSHSVLDVFTNCYIVRNALTARSVLPVGRSTSGFYWLDDFNAVYVSCLGGSTWFRGFGALPLQNAYRYANVSGASGCTFVVD